MKIYPVFLCFSSHVFDLYVDWLIHVNRISNYVLVHVLRILHCILKVERIFWSNKSNFKKRISYFKSGSNLLGLYIVINFKYNKLILFAWKQTLKWADMFYAATVGASAACARYFTFKTNHTVPGRERNEPYRAKRTVPCKHRAIIIYAWPTPKQPKKRFVLCKKRATSIYGLIY